MSDFEHIIRHLQRLIEIPSISGQEDRIAAYITQNAGRFESLRVGNSVAVKLQGAQADHLLILNGHIDTVSPEPLDKWQSDPYVLTKKQDAYYGLGASDMKAGIAYMLWLLEKYQTQEPPCAMWMLFAEQEEVDGRGTQQLLKALVPELDQYESVGALILEPTDAEAIEFGHRGSVFIEVSASGASGHASVDTQGQAATQKLVDFLGQVPGLQQDWQARYTHNVLGQPTINVTQLKAGNASPNVVQKTAHATLDARLTPELFKHFEAEIAALHKKYPEITFKTKGLTGYGLCEPAHKWSVLVSSTLQLPLEIARGATDQVFFTQAGIPALIYGPGTKTVIHAPNEYVEAPKIKTAYQGLQEVITAFSQM